MGVLANEVLAGGGEVTGVLPHALASREVAHDGLTRLHLVDSMHARKALMADLSDGFVAIPGGWGTLEEWFEVLTWGQLGIHAKPSGLVNAAGYFDGLLKFLEHAVAERFVRPEQSALVLTASSGAVLLDRMAVQALPPIAPSIDKDER
jgi:uncharacterized protein (TIGR00730 family)